MSSAGNITHATHLIIAPWRQRQSRGLLYSETVHQLPVGSGVAVTNESSEGRSSTAQHSHIRPSSAQAGIQLFKQQAHCAHHSGRLAAQDASSPRGGTEGSTTKLLLVVLNTSQRSQFHEVLTLYPSLLLGQGAGLPNAVRSTSTRAPPDIATNVMQPAIPVALPAAAKDATCLRRDQFEGVGRKLWRLSHWVPASASQGRLQVPAAQLVSTPLPVCGRT